MVASLRDAALAYVAKGLSVFPLHGIAGSCCTCGTQDCRSPGKHPRTRRGLKDATTDPATIQNWWTRWPDANIGIPTGKVSGFFAVDVDHYHGGDDALRDLEHRYGELPVTVRQLTGSGGEHILFRHVEGLRSSAGRLGPGLDVRAEGGYIVVEPSLHISGRQYAWEVDHHPSDLPIAVARSWLLTRIRGGASDNCAAMANPSTRLVQAISQPCSEGRRNDTIARLTGYLLRRNVHPYAVLELARLWNHGRCQPPLEDAEVLRTVNSICLREAQRREIRNG
jgi:hypothetical protein